MKIYSFSTELEAAVAGLLEDTRVLSSELSNYRGAESAIRTSQSESIS